jgi:hypothetical protein
MEHAMTAGTTSDQRLSRRWLLQAAAGAAAVLGTAAPAAAQIKISQAAAGYQDHPNGDHRCLACAHFRQPDKCQLISGSISPQGWCRLFSPLSGQASAAQSNRST